MVDELLTRAEAAQFLKVSVATLDRWVREGKIKSIELPGRTIRFTKEGLLRQVGVDPQNP